VWITSVAGTLASIVGLLVALLQTRRLKELRRHTEADTWEAVRILRSAYHYMSKSECLKSGDPDVREARGKVTETIRHLIKQAALAESKFSETTIANWKALGRIESDWHVEAARLHLPPGK